MITHLRWFSFLVLFIFLQSCSNSSLSPITSVSPSVVSVTQGRASYYGGRFHGRTTANGEAFDKNALTAAHRTLPFGSKVRVTNLKNKQSVVVRINDRGPYAKGRIIDLSEQAARKIGMLNAGVVRVKLEQLK